MPKSNDELDSAIQKFWREQPPEGGMVTKWMLVVEGIGSEGRRWLDYAWTEDMTTWDVRGLLHETLDQQLSGQLADQLLEDDGDG